jgi:hypothetical protein
LTRRRKAPHLRQVASSISETTAIGSSGESTKPAVMGPTRAPTVTFAPHSGHVDEFISTLYSSLTTRASAPSGLVAVRATSLASANSDSKDCGRGPWNVAQHETDEPPHLEASLDRGSRGSLLLLRPRLRPFGCPHISQGCAAERRSASRVEPRPT